MSMMDLTRWKQANLDYGFNDIRTAEDYRDKLMDIQDKDSET